MIRLTFLSTDNYYQEVTSLKNSHPDLKVILLVGGPADLTTGGSQMSVAFSEVVNSTETVDLFVDNVVYYLRYFDFDGMELDWRYPGYFGSIPEDVYRFTVLVRVRTLPIHSLPVGIRRRKKNTLFYFSPPSYQNDKCGYSQERLKKN